LGQDGKNPEAELAEEFQTRTLGTTADAIAPDGSEVRLLATSARGSMAHFRLAAGGVSKAVKHRRVEELWFFTGGEGETWRRSATGESVVAVKAGVSISIPVGVEFQFRARGEVALEAVAVTMPPWPGMDEAVTCDGVWEATA
jgi:mannose-6-phosphate isomerase-like protein (cupin superfamily)